MKFLFILLLCLVSANSYGCFVQPEGLTEQHILESKTFFWMAIILFVVSVTFRCISNFRRIWVPLLFVTSFTYWPAYIWHWGQAYSGSCGIPETVLALKILASGMGALLVYEVFIFFKMRRSGKV
jgi:hypothetical protein